MRKYFYASCSKRDMVEYFSFIGHLPYFNFCYSRVLQCTKSLIDQGHKLPQTFRRLVVAQ